jgi:hypothetical protein
MEYEEPGEGGSGNDRPPQHHVYQRVADERYPAGNRRSNTQPPICVLIEAQNLARERHSQRHQQKKHAKNPGQFTRIFVRPKQKHLCHMDQHDCDHEIRSPAVHRA